jgi:hypothetical protein
MSETMPSPEFAPLRTDRNRVGERIKELIRLMTEEALTWRAAADKLEIPHRTAQRALGKPHVIQYRRQQRARLLDELNSTIPQRLYDLMFGENQNASVRAAAELAKLASEELAPRRPAFGSIVQTPGLTIQIISDSPKPQPAPPMTTIGHAPQLIEQKAADDE